MEILNTIQNTAQAGYNLIGNTVQNTAQAGYNFCGANGVRAISAAVKVGVNYLIWQDIQVSVAASVLQLGLAYTTSAVSNSSVVTAGAIVAGSALINGAFYGCNGLNLCSPKKEAAQLAPAGNEEAAQLAPGSDNSKLIAGGINFVIDALTERVIYCMEETDTNVDEIIPPIIDASLDF